MCKNNGKNNHCFGEFQEKFIVGDKGKKHMKIKQRMDVMYVIDVKAAD